MDVSPRLGAPVANAEPETHGRTPRRGRARNLALLGVIIVALGFVVFRGLGSATLFFYNVDEAVTKQAELGPRRFRLQGSVVPDTIARGERSATFEVTFNGAIAKVSHEGDLPQLFQPEIPVVLEGHWAGDTFSSDRMLVKHSEVYTAANSDRTQGYEA